MKRIFIFLLLFSLQVSAESNKFYLGAEGQWLNMPFKHGYGDNLLKRSTLGVNPFFGVKFNDNVGVELGYRYHSNNRTSTLKSGEISAGEVINPYIAPATYETTMRLKGPHLSLIVSTTRTECNPLQLFVGFGLTETKATFIRNTIHLNRYTLNAFSRRMEKTRTLKRFTLGTNYFLTNNLAVRGAVVFENTNRLLANCNDGLSLASFPKIKPEKSINYGLGLFWSF